MTCQPAQHTFFKAATCSFYQVLCNVFFSCECVIHCQVSSPQKMETSKEIERNCRCSTQASSTETMDEKKHAKDEKANLKIGDSESKD